MSEDNDAFVLDHRVEIRIPSQCVCKKPLPEDDRQQVLTEVATLFGTWFGGGEIEPKKGIWTLPDGTLAEE